MDERFGDWMQTFSGRKFWPLDPRASEVFIEDIAHSLSLQCRYAGHCLRPYSVAEHSVHIARWLQSEGWDTHTALWGLLHDAGEAYVLDMVRPLKRSFPEFKAIERKVMCAVCERFGLYPIEPDAVTDADNRILADEKRQNMTPGLDWVTDSLEPLGVPLRFWSAAEAEFQFRSTFDGLIVAQQAA